jgi:long-subunit acyl-CoA synthetase (AMP-forming)
MDHSALPHGEDVVAIQPALEVVAAQLRQHGIGVGDKVSLFSPNCPEWLIARLNQERRTGAKAAAGAQVTAIWMSP